MKHKLWRHLLRRGHLNTDELKNKERRKEIMDYIEKENPHVSELSSNEFKAYMATYFQEKEVERRTKLKEHLEVFNDAVLAIIITIIVLNLPMPKTVSQQSMMELIETIGVYIVSFIVIANFWLMHHFIFAKIKTGISESLVVLDFLFMAEVSLLPFLTKWTVQNHSSVPVVMYGGVYLLATITLIIMSMRINQRIKTIYPKLYKQLNKIEWYRLIVIIPINLLLMVGAIFIPKVIFLLYVVMPVFTFLSYIFADDEERDFEAHLSALNHEEMTQDVVAKQVAEQISENIEEKVSDVIDEKIKSKSSIDA